MKALAVAAALLAVGCGQTLDPHGPASLCEDRYPELDIAINDAVYYWVSAGLTGLHGCADGSIYVTVMDSEPTDENDSIGLETPYPLGISIAPSMLAKAQNGDPIVGEVLAHELGHALGLGHDADESSVMWHLVHALPDAPGPTDLQLADKLLGR